MKPRVKRDRVRLMGAVVIAALACSTAPVGFTYSPASDIGSHVEHLKWANRKVFVVTEGHGQLATGERLYYIAYVTTEPVVLDRETIGQAPGDPLWGEIQALWVQRRPTLNPKELSYVVIDARSEAGETGYTTRRAVFQSKGGETWLVYPRAQFILEQ